MIVDVGYGVAARRPSQGSYRVQVMSLDEILKPDAVIPALRVNGKKQALQELSERAAIVANLPAREIFDAILQRERLGPTGVGDVAA